jgi:hypothetical protein
MSLTLNWQYSLPVLSQDLCRCLYGFCPLLCLHTYVVGSSRTRLLWGSPPAFVQLSLASRIGFVDTAKTIVCVLGLWFETFSDGDPIPPHTRTQKSLITDQKKNSADINLCAFIFWVLEFRRLILSLMLKWDFAKHRAKHCDFSTVLLTWTLSVLVSSRSLLLRGWIYVLITHNLK